MPIIEVRDGAGDGFLPFQVSHEKGQLVLSAELPSSGEGLGARLLLQHHLENLRRIWIPHLTPYPGYVAGDHAFRSPAVILADDTTAVALIPDIDDLADLQRQGMTDKDLGLRAWLDYDHPASTIAIAVGNYRLGEHHVSYQASPARYAGQNIALRVHVLISTERADIENPYGMAARFLWEKWGHAIHEAGGSQRAPFSVYEDHINRWTFTPEPDGWEDSVWQSLTIDGKQCGGPAFIIDVEQHPSVPLDERRWREPKSVWNQAWFSTQRCANGLMRFARQTGSEEIENSARLMTNFAISAPQTDGLFPAVYTTDGGYYSLYKDASDWDKGHWTNSNRRPSEASAEACHILDASFTARNLLEWMDIVGEDEGIQKYVLNYAGRVLELQRPGGAFPGWVEPDGSVPDVLVEGPETAMTASLLLELAARYPYHRDVVRWRSAAKTSLEYLLNGPVKEARWEDFETYYSCSRWGKPGELVGRNGIYKHNTFSMFWCAEAFLKAYYAFGNDEYLSVGKRCLDELSLYQQVWNPPYLLADCHGGFGVMNFDGEWNDARQSLFAPLYMDYYKTTGVREYFERGISALRVSFAMLYCPENADVKREYERRHPFFGPESYGFMMENIGHEGWGGEPIGTFTIYTWGNGAALSAAATVKDVYGDVYLDSVRRTAFGIDGCRAVVEGGEVVVQDRYGRDSLILVYDNGTRSNVKLVGGRGRAPIEP